MNNEQVEIKNEVELLDGSKIAVKSLTDIYNNLKVIKSKTVELEFEEPQFTKFLSQIKAAKALNVRTDSLGGYTTEYKGVTLKVKLTGLRMHEKDMRIYKGDNEL